MPTNDSKDKAPAGGDAGQKEMQEREDKIEEQGFMGKQVDMTPRENYSLQTPQDAPTPETTERVKVAEELNADKMEARKSSK